MKKRITAAIATLCVLAALAWIGGFDFDKRDPFVAYFTGLALVIAAFVASAPSLGDDK